MPIHWWHITSFKMHDLDIFLLSTTTVMVWIEGWVFSRADAMAQQTEVRRLLTLMRIERKAGNIKIFKSYSAVFGLSP